MENIFITAGKFPAPWGDPLALVFWCHDTPPLAAGIFIKRLLPLANIRCVEAQLPPIHWELGQYSEFIERIQGKTKRRLVHMIQEVFNQAQLNDA